MKTTLILVLLFVEMLISAPVFADASETNIGNAFTVSAMGGRLIEYKKFSSNGDSAWIASLAMYRWINTSESDIYTQSTNSTTRYDASTQQ